jgi:hypothetical protein
MSILCRNNESFEKINSMDGIFGLKRKRDHAIYLGIDRNRPGLKGFQFGANNETIFYGTFEEYNCSKITLN